jgi:hypothetical protein
MLLIDTRTPPFRPETVALPYTMGLREHRQ